MMRWKVQRVQRLVQETVTTQVPPRKEKSNQKRAPKSSQMSRTLFLMKGKERRAAVLQNANFALALFHTKEVHRIFGDTLDESTRQVILVHNNFGTLLWTMVSKAAPKSPPSGKKQHVILNLSSEFNLVVY